MAVRYINNDQPKVVKVVSEPQPPAPQPPTAPAVNLPAIGAKKAALQAELNAVQTAEQQRINAELEAARKQNQLQAEIAELERAEREAAVGVFIERANRQATGDMTTVTNLYKELNAIGESIENITYATNLKAVFAGYVDTAQQAVAHAMPADYDELGARKRAAAVLSQLPPPPLALVPALKQWIALAPAGSPQRHLRAGIVLALTGNLFRDIDLPVGYDANRESAEILRSLTLPS